MPGRKVEYARAGEGEEAKEGAVKDNQANQEEQKTTIWSMINYALAVYLVFMALKYFYTGGADDGNHL